MIVPKDKNIKKAGLLVKITYDSEIYETINDLFRAITIEHLGIHFSDHSDISNPNMKTSTYYFKHSPFGRDFQSVIESYGRFVVESEEIDLDIPE